MEKKQVRIWIKEKKKSLSKREIEEWSKQVIQKFFSTNEYKLCETLYCYVSYNQEVNTHPLIEQALADGKRVAVPKIIEEIEKKYMEFFFISSMDELIKGYQGILEPSTNHLAQEKNGVILMPGLAFDPYFHRIGYGGGFYDRYLHREKERNHLFYKLALCFDFQIVPNLETEEFDETVDAILTPTCSYGIKI